MSEENKPVDTQQIPQAQNTAVEEKAEAEETQEQIDWRKYREKRKMERKQKEDLEKRMVEKEAEAQALKAAMESLVNRQPASSYQDPAEETEDNRIEKKVKQLLQEERRALEEQRIAKEQQELPKLLKDNFSDFDEVCSTENLDYLQYHFPEIADEFKDSPDSYKKWARIYKVVKRFIPVVDSKKDQKKAEKNLTKPQSMSVAGTTQTGDNAPTILNQQRKDDNWKRIRKTLSGG